MGSIARRSCTPWLTRDGRAHLGVQLDLSHNELSPEAAKALAQAIRSCSSLVQVRVRVGGRLGGAIFALDWSIDRARWPDVQIDISNNKLCGIDRGGSGAYTADGIQAIAQSMFVSPSLHWIDVGYNFIEQAEALEILASIKAERVVSIGLGLCDLGPNGAKVVAAILATSHTLRKVSAS